MNRLQLRLPLPPHLERAPELAALAILDAALTASEAALLASHAELYNGMVGSLVARAPCAPMPSSCTLAGSPWLSPRTVTPSTATRAATSALATASASESPRS
jgi:hypothetical protein